MTNENNNSSAGFVAIVVILALIIGFLLLKGWVDENRDRQWLECKKTVDDNSASDPNYLLLLEMTCGKYRQ